jgi:CheY-like chemotaxis protein
MPTATSHVAIVDRDRSLAELLVQLLGSSGYACLACYTAADAIARLPQEPLSVALVELHLERRDAGLDVVAALRMPPSSRRVPIVLWSADPRVRTLSLQSSMNDVVVREKPVPPADLLTLVAALEQR